MRIFGRRKRGSEEGQSLTELAIGLPFVMLVIIAIIEMGLVFATYVSMINATREGAVFASMHPEITNATNDSDIVAPGTTTLWEEYQARVRNEVFVAVTQKLTTNELLTQDDLTVARPVIAGSTYSAGDPITVTVVYSISTFTSNISLPFFGRFGLPNRYRLAYSFVMPIR